MTSAAAALRSDHVNLLVFRYLQEVGFESAATALYNDWHRPAECRDPETLPFAHTIPRNELVSVIQTGLFHDELQARSSKGQPRRFRWTRLDARDSVERQDRVVENGIGPRARGRPPAMRAPDEFPTPAPKRPKRNEGSEGHPNGDRDQMDVDATSADADGEEDGDVASAGVSEPEPAEVERYDSMDVATQTQIKTGPKTSTMYWKIDKPGASVMHGMWNPDADPKNSKTLLTVGDSLCRFYQVPEAMDDAKQISHIDEPSVLAGSAVTAIAWRPDGRGASCAVDGIRELPDGTQLALQTLIEHNREGSSVSFQLGPPLMEPPGIVTGLYYSPNGEYLLLTRMNLKRGMVQIWKTPSLDPDAPRTPMEPLAWRVFDNPVLDVAWIGDDAFLVSGENGLSASYQVDSSYNQEPGLVAGSTIAMRGLILHNASVIASSDSLDKLRFDERHKIAVFASTDARKLFITPIPEISAGDTQAGIEVDLREKLTAIAFQPWQRPKDETAAAADYEAESLLAIAFEDGSCAIYCLTRSEAGGKCREFVMLWLTEGAATTLAWSPNGDRLAVGNSDLLQIWYTNSLRPKNGTLQKTNPSVTWRPASESNGHQNGHNEELPTPEPSFSWSADSESLAFAADRQIAVIRFRPSLSDQGLQSEQNGVLSP